MTATITDLLARVEWRADCAVWTGWTNDDGYGYVRAEGRDQPVHRVMYQLARGTLPVGMEIDQVCQKRACINVDHIEAVTHAENQRRIALRQTSCRRAGHDWTDPRNVRVRPNGRRYCAECERIAQRTSYAKRHQ